MSIERNYFRGIFKEFGLYIIDKFTSRKELLEILEIFRGYYKIESLVYFHLLGLPTLGAIIITQWNDKVRNILESYTIQQKIRYFTLRSDKKDEVPDAPRLGLNVTLHDIEKHFTKYLKDGRILFLVEYRSRYDDLYSFNLLFHPNHPSQIYMEVVGPGFDASDLKRGDVTPHEIIWLPRSPPPLVPEAIERKVIPKPHYKGTVLLRLEKIGKEIALLQNIDTRSWSPQNFRDLAIRYLSQTGETLLLQYSEEYPPIPFDYLRQIHYMCFNLPGKMRELKIREEPFVLCGSIFNINKEIGFWEFTWPELKYETLFQKLKSNRHRSIF
jgi:hypothetical protein